MSNKSREITVYVRGIRYEEFAKVKWQQFLRLCSLVAMVAVAAVLVGVIAGKISSDIPVSAGLTVLLIVLAILAVYRSSIRSEYKRTGLSGVELIYRFDRDGWTVKQGGSKVTVLWSKTLRLKKNPNALLLYPNKKSVNILPLRCMTGEELAGIIAFCTGKKA